jgi:hypothetical protein
MKQARYRDTGAKQGKTNHFYGITKDKHLTLCGMDIATVASSLKSRQDLTIDIYRESYSLLAS